MKPDEVRRQLPDFERRVAAVAQERGIISRLC
jgi:hypothetical protein